MNKKEIEYILSCLNCYVKNIKLDNTFFDNLDKQYIKNICEKNRIFPIIQYVNSNGEYKNEALERLLFLRMKAIIDVLNQLETHKIKYAVIKGPYLAQVAYHRMDLRTMNDLDILIDIKDASKIKKIFEENGWITGKVDRINWKIITYDRDKEIAFKLNTHQLATMSKIFKDEVLDYYDCVVDFNFKVTWGAFDGKEIPIDLLLENRKFVKDIFGFGYYVLNEELFLIQLCLHLFKEANDLYFIYSNNGLFLRGFLDIFYYLLSVEINVNIFLETLKEYSLQKYIYYAIWYVNELFPNYSKIENILNDVSNYCSDKDKDIVNCFGLNEEIKYWNVSIIDRFFSQTLLKDKSYFSNKELDKIDIVKNKFY